MTGTNGSPWTWGAALLAVVGSTLLALALDPLVSEGDLAMVYLLGVVSVAYHVPLGPSVLAAVASVMALNFFFVAPRHTFAVDQAENLLTFAVMGTVGVLTSGLAARIRQDKLDAAEREQHTAALYAFSREIASIDDEATLEVATVEHLRRLVGGHVRWSRELEQGEMTTVLGSVGPLGAIHLCGGPSLTSTAGQETVRALLGQAALAAERLAAHRAKRESDLALEAERTRSSLLSSLSHDLRTPLSTILLATGTLLDPTVLLNPATRVELLTNAHKEAHRLHELVHKLLEMTRVSGPVQLRPDWHVPSDVVGSALARAADMLAPEDVHVDADVELAWLDDTLVEVALANLIENAARYGTPPIHIEVRAEDTWVRFSVRDQGPGCSAPDAARLFERFVRGDNAIGVQGSGLGLAIVRAVAEAHGGSATMEPLDLGVRFAVLLPQPSVAPALSFDDHVPLTRP